jgi:hypothetical protein
MAILRRITCLNCGETKEECRSSSDYSVLCQTCKRDEKDKKEREWKAGREGLTLEERIRDIEHFMYHHGTHYTGPAIFG